jgi:small subunit ribosomal protein S18
MMMSSMMRRVINGGKSAQRRLHESSFSFLNSSSSSSFSSSSHRGRANIDCQKRTSDGTKSIPTNSIINRFSSTAIATATDDDDQKKKKEEKKNRFMSTRSFASQKSVISDDDDDDDDDHDDHKKTKKNEEAGIDETREKEEIITEQEIQQQEREQQQTRVSNSRVFYPGQIYEPEELEGFSPKTTASLKTRRVLQKNGKELNELVQRQINWRDAKMLTRYVSETGKISARRLSGLSAKTHRVVVKNIKIARILGVIPFTDRLPQFARRKKNPYS